jgi:hypothetical protein
MRSQTRVQIISAPFCQQVTTDKVRNLLRTVGVPEVNLKGDGAKKRSDVQEALLQLYPRLNGYFTTGFVVQSPDWGRNKAQIDALAVRLPLNREPERLLGSSPFLERPQPFRTAIRSCFR